MNELIPILPGTDINQYIATVKKIPHLTEEEEQELCFKYYETGDIKTAHKIVLSHLYYVISIAKKYSGYGLPLSDLIQEGNIGLMKAVKKFDPYRGIKFASYALMSIKGEIFQFILDNWKIVKVATTKAQRKLFFNLRKHINDFKHIDNKQAIEIADDLNVKPHDVQEMQQRLYTTVDTFNTIDVYDEENNGNEVAYIADSTTNPETLLEEEQSDQLSQVKQLLDQLNERERIIITSRWLSTKKTPLKTLSERFNVSKERIRQIEEVAINKLKSML